MTDFKKFALRYFDSGHRVIPMKFSPSGDKVPMAAWGKYRERQSREDVIREFSKNGIDGIMIITGVNGLEVIDVDQKYALHPGLMLKMLAHNSAFGGIDVQRLVTQTTKNGGWHIIYRTAAPGPNQELARRPATYNELAKENEKVRAFNERLKAEQFMGRRTQESLQNEFKSPADLPKVLIETRGRGGLLVVHPTPGYEIDSGDLCDIPNIGEADRTALFQAARALNQQVSKRELSIIDTEINRNFKPMPGTEEGTPWNDYNINGDWKDLLERNGWTFNHKRKDSSTGNDYYYFTRPGKKTGVSLGWNDTRKFFWVHTSSTFLEKDRGYTLTAMRAALEFHGNYREACRALRKEGFGSDDYVKVTAQTKTDVLELGRWRITDPRPENVWLLKIMDRGEWKPIGGEGQIMVIDGYEKSGKSTFVGAVSGSSSNPGKEVLGLKATEAMRGRAVIDIDTEMDDPSYDSSRRIRMHTAGFTKEMPENYYSYNLREMLTAAERWERIMQIVEAVPNPGVLILDGGMDLVNNQNDLEENQLVSRRIMKIASKYKMLVVVIIHFSKSGTGFGHLAGFLNRKLNVQFTISKDDDREVMTVTNPRIRGQRYLEAFDIKWCDGRPQRVDHLIKEEEDFWTASGVVDPDKNGNGAQEATQGEWKQFSVVPSLPINGNGKAHHNGNSVQISRDRAPGSDEMIEFD